MTKVKVRNLSITILFEIWNLTFEIIKMDPETSSG
jgi:hypothetical protein